MVLPNMTEAWLIVNQEFDTPYIDDKCKVFYDSSKAYEEVLRLNNLPENRGRMMFNIKPENGYGIYYPYGFKKIELVS